MAESIESFVSKLQTEGVQAGQQAAEKLRAEAQQQADAIIQHAKEQGEKILTEARQDGEKLLSRSRTELRLAARDTILRLRDALNRALQEVLTTGAEQKLTDPEFLGKLLHELAVTHAQADIEHKERIMIDLRPDLRDKLLDWALRESTQEARAAGVHMDLKGTLKEAGFEYSVSDAKVEVTLSSVVQTLSEMVSPKLREVIDQAVSENESGENAPDQRPREDQQKAEQ
jgi:V/A-type H+-transporting ATPase subunit E